MPAELICSRAETSPRSRRGRSRSHEVRRRAASALESSVCVRPQLNLDHVAIAGRLWVAKQHPAVPTPRLMPFVVYRPTVEVDFSLRPRFLTSRAVTVQKLQRTLPF